MYPILRNIKDPVSSLTHLTGAALSLAGLVAMMSQSWSDPDPTRLIGVTIFGISMILLYTSSGLYHWFDLSERGNLVLRKLDHAMIYILIAGSYTPYCLLAMDASIKWWYLGGIWSLSVIGIVVKMFWFRAPRWLSTAFYLLMGWLAVAGIPGMQTQIGSQAIFWTIAGGLFYSIGAIVYMVKKPNPVPGVFGFHEIWHLFVMAGTASHFWAVYRFM